MISCARYEPPQRQSAGRGRYRCGDSSVAKGCGQRVERNICAVASWWRPPARLAKWLLGRTVQSIEFSGTYVVPLA